MEALLQIAARVEAAVETYVSVRNTADFLEWKDFFTKEGVSSPFS
jgi:hypothetical protein